MCPVGRAGLLLIACARARVRPPNGTVPHDRHRVVGTAARYRARRRGCDGKSHNVRDRPAQLTTWDSPNPPCALVTRGACVRADGFSGGRRRRCWTVPIGGPSRTVELGAVIAGQAGRLFSLRRTCSLHGRRKRISGIPARGNGRAGLQGPVCPFLNLKERKERRERLFAFFAVRGAGQPRTIRSSDDGQAARLISGARPNPRLRVRVSPQAAALYSRLKIFDC